MDAEADIGEEIEMGKQVVVLEDQRYGTLRRRKTRHILAGNLDAAGYRLFET